MALIYFKTFSSNTFLSAMIIRAASSKFVSSSIPSWQILTAHAQPFRGARDLAFCLKVPLYSLLVWASSGGSGETARMRRLAWTFAARIGDKYQIRLMRPITSAIMELVQDSLVFIKRSFRDHIITDLMSQQSNALEYVENNTQLRQQFIAK